MGVHQHPAYPEELGRLRRTTAVATALFRRLAGSSALTREGEDLFAESMHATRAAEEVLEGQRFSTLRRLRQAMIEPYFGRIDFQADTRPESPIEHFYVGKAALGDPESGTPLVIDWRAPVAALFYTGAGADDRSGYDAPGGRVEGILWLKRHFQTRRGVLRHIADSHVRGSGGGGMGDAYLLYALEESRDHRLREIVANIQAEQNQLIRAPANRPILIQGAAGSGKTSVALHRVAYLLYTNRDTMAPERVLVLAPNRIFQDYISDVLPELGLRGIYQTTFTGWALAQLHPRPPLSDPPPSVDGRGPAELRADHQGRRRNSADFMAELDAALADYAENGLPTADLELWPGACLSRAQIACWYQSDYVDWPINRRRKRVLARILRWARRQADAYLGTDVERPRRLSAFLAVRAYARSWPRQTALSLYRRVTGHAPGPVDAADLAPLVYLQERLEGLRDQRCFDHVVIDEGQDVSPLQVALLRRFTVGDSFTILGDLAQGIDPGTALRDWQELIDVFPPGSVDCHELPVSYRSTHAITTFSQHVLQQIAGARPAPQPVFRPGPPVRLGPRAAGALADPVAAEVRRLQQREYASIAVVGRTPAECTAIHAGLSAERLRPRRITARDDRYRGGLSVIPAHLTKGLEFDAVIVADAGESNYPGGLEGARLLYVVLTRALHELTVFYCGRPSPLLANLPAELYSPVAAISPR